MLQIQPPEEIAQVASSSFPHRPETPDCLHYTRTGFCNYGINCRFNHPPNKMLDTASCARGKEEYPERVGEPECQFYLKTGTCKFGLSCKYHHPKEKAGILGKTSINEAGYPMRLGEKDCAYYMQTGTCKYGTTCKFNHPQPPSIHSLLEIGGSPMYASAGTTSIPSNPAFPFWPFTRAAFLQGLPIQRFCSPSMLVPPESLNLSMRGWNSYQGLTRTMLPTSPLDIKQQPIAGTAMYGAATPQNIQVPYNPYMAGNAATSFWYSFMMSKDSLYPERPGQPECKYFIRTGDCKFGISCRFDHPKRRNLLLPHGSLSPMGLPQRPGIEPCTFYMQYGSCKFGPLCRFDHPFSNLTYSPSHKPVMNCPFFPYPLMHTFPKPLQTTFDIGVASVQQGNREIERAVNDEKQHVTNLATAEMGRSNANPSAST